MRRLLLAAFAVVSMLLALAPGAVLGSCMMPPSIEEAVETADVVFVGTVMQTSNRDLWATVEVTEVWRGPDQPSAVLVKGGSGGDAMTSVDRTFQAGVTYLFFPFADTQQGLADNACSSTTEWTADLVALRPADYRSPIGAATEPSGFDASDVLVPIGVAVVVGGALFLAGLAARGRRAD